jgi:hypothetical protein
VWNQSNGKQMILVSMDTHMYKQCIIKQLKKECSRLASSGCQSKGGNSVFFTKKCIHYISLNK